MFLYCCTEGNVSFGLIEPALLTERSGSRFKILSYSRSVSLFFLFPAKPQISLRQPNHRWRGGSRGGGGGAGRGSGPGDFRQTRDIRDGHSEGRIWAHSNKFPNQNTANKKGNVPAEK